MNLQTVKLTIVAATMVIGCGALDRSNATELRSPVVVDSNTVKMGDQWEPKVPLEKLRNEAAKADPIQLLIMAVKLHDLGQDDEALFWFFVGGARNGAIDAIAPSSSRTNELVALLGTLGGVLHLQMVRDPEKALETIDRAIAWDQQNGFDPTPYAQAARVAAPDWAAIRDRQTEGLRQMRAKILEIQTKK